MRLALDTTPQEYWLKRDTLIKALVDRIGQFDPELAETLEKALPAKEPELKYKAMQELHDQTAVEYSKMLKRMTADITEVLKSGKQRYHKPLKKAEGDEPEEYKSPEEIEYEKEYDPETGEPRPEPEDDEDVDDSEEGDPDGIDTEKSLEKAGPFIGPRGGKWADAKHTIPWKDAKKAVKVKVPVMRVPVYGQSKHIPANKESVKSLEIVNAIDENRWRVNMGGKRFVLSIHKTGASLLSSALKRPVKYTVMLSPEEIHDLMRPARQAFNMEKALYIGPRGGRWADAKHTIPYKDAGAVDKQKLAKFIKQQGGKVRPHKSDPNMVVVKFPKSKAAELAKVKQEYNIAEEIIIGGQYAILPMSKTKVAKYSTKHTHNKGKDMEWVESWVKGPPSKMPEYVAGQWEEPKSLEDASAWCQARGIHTHFPDLPTAVEVTKAISEQHPLVLKHIQFVGTGEQLKAWAKDNPDIVDKAKSGKKSLDISKHSPLGGSAIAGAHPIGKKPYDMSAIVVKDSWWNEKKTKAGGASDSGFSLSESVGDVVRHECGHVEAFTLRHIKSDGGATMWDLWKANHAVPMLKQEKHKVIKDVSQYAATNPHELWAEVAVLRRTPGKHIANWLVAAFNKMGVDTLDWNKQAGTDWSKG